jgi:hypothetical protein
MNTHLIIPDSHAHYQHHNKRAEWLGRLINDVKPDVVIHIGDSADMPSLSSYDRGKKSFQGRTYRADIDSHLDFQSRLWDTVRATKKRLPRRVFCIGNHEQRIHKAIDVQPELEGVIGFGDLQLEDFYDEVIPYDGLTPGVINIDGVHYAHYHVSGVMGKPIAGVHSAYSLTAKRFVSCTAGHSHLADLNFQTNGDGKKVIGCLVGSYMDYHSDWAGSASDYWWSGVVVKRNVVNGMYDPQFISLESIKREYQYGT